MATMSNSLVLHAVRIIDGEQWARMFTTTKLVLGLLFASARRQRLAVCQHWTLGWRAESDFPRLVGVSRIRHLGQTKNARAMLVRVRCTLMADECPLGARFGSHVPQPDVLAV
jgi:hypothetical protein